MECKKCNRETDENCKQCPEYRRLTGKKGLLLIDGSKNAVILNYEELERIGLSEQLKRQGIMATARKNKTMKDLDRCVRDYLEGGWPDV